MSVKSLFPLKVECQHEVLPFRGHNVKVLRKPFRRRLSLTIRLDGTVQLKAAVQTPMRQIVRFLEDHVDWIKRTSQKFDKEREKFPPAQFVEGETFLFEGQNLRLHFEPGQQSEFQFEFGPRLLIVRVPPSQWTGDFNKKAHPEIQKSLAQTARRRACDVLVRRLHHWMNVIGLRPTQISIRGQKSRWGSMSSERHMSLNWRLVAAPIEVIDYVIIHELCHIRHHNHGPQFWRLVANFDPKYREHRGWLRHHHLAFAYLND